MYALDTNAVIHLFKGLGRIREHVEATPPGEIGLPAVALYELEVGLTLSSQPKKRRTDLDAFLPLVRVLPLDSEAAKHAAEVRAALAPRGIVIGPLDILIAGTALAHHATLVTHNRGEFLRVKGLKVVDWL